jgi:hypothetical protein
MPITLKESAFMWRHDSRDFVIVILGHVIQHPRFS